MSEYKKVAILVNSTDKYSDCWPIFFFFLNKYWGKCKYGIYLNTEFLTYEDSNFEIFSTKLGLIGSRSSWSQCLLSAVSLIDADFILYMQEDYFINNFINDSEIENAISAMDSDPSVGLIELTLFGSMGPFKKYPRLNHFCIVEKSSRYRISCQAALWRKTFLKEVLLEHENGWLFEIVGTLRSVFFDSKVLSLNREIYKIPIISYIHTGIIKKQWNKNIVNQILEYDKNFNFNKRGFYKLKNKFFNKIETVLFLMKTPSHFFDSLLDLIKIYVHSRFK